MSRPRNNRDNILVIFGLGLIFFGIKKLLGTEDYTNWFLYGGIFVAAGVLDPLLALTGKKIKRKFIVGTRIDIINGYGVNS